VRQVSEAPRKVLGINFEASLHFVGLIEEERMVKQTWLVDAILYIYALGLLFYFSDFAKANRSAKRMGTGLLIFVWVLESFYLATHIFEHELLSAYTKTETLLLFAWAVLTLSLIINRFLRVELFVFIINIVGFAAFAFNVFGNPEMVPSRPGWEIDDELLFVHISLAVAAYAAFAVAAVFSGMYLFLHRRLKGKQWSPAVKRLPSLEKINTYAFRASISGIPLLVAALALGIVWVLLQGDAVLLLDAKVINSLVVLAAYLYYYLMRQFFQPAGNRLALWNLYAFGIVLLNLILTNYMSSFHHWL
jgi:HemX protein